MRALSVILLCFVAACGGSGGGSGSSSSSGGGGGGTVASNPSSMAVGDVSYVDLSNGSGSAQFPSSGKFEVLLQSQDTGSSTNSITANSESSAGKALALGAFEDEASLSEGVLLDQHVLDETLRDNDLYWSSLSESSQNAVSLAASEGGSNNRNVDTAVSTGETASLYVLSSLTSTTQCVSVTATAKYVSSQVAIFVDNEVLSRNPGDLSQADIDALGAIYDRELPNLRDWLGGYSDINNDGVVVALITSQLNKLAGGGGGVVTGYFNSDDFSAYNASSNPCSNNREIVYLVAPDSGGLYGTRISNRFYMSNFAPSVFPHETQHLINYYQRVVVRGAPAETSCLNEGLSHLVEDLVGYNVENPSRYNLFLASPQSYSACGSTSLAGRGGIYLFLRYLYERSGNSKDFLKNLVQTSERGYVNILNALPNKSGDFDSAGKFLRDWAVALGYSNRGIATADRFKYQDRAKNAVTGNWEGVCLNCAAEDHRGTVITGPSFGSYSDGTYSVRDAAIRFLRLGSNPSQITFSTTRGSRGYAIILRTQ